MQTASLSRRRLLAAAVGLPVLGALGWQLRPTVPAEFPVRPLPPTEPRPRLLVAYGSMMGATAETASWMADEARALGWNVGLYPVAGAPPPEGFDAVLLGSAIKASAWLPEVVDWAGRHAAALSARPVALFQTSMMCAGLTERGTRPLDEAGIGQLQPTLDTLRAAAPSLRAAAVAFLPGRLEFARLAPAVRIAYPLVSGSVLSGDFRNPGWTRDYARNQLQSAPFRNASGT